MELQFLNTFIFKQIDCQHWGSIKAGLPESHYNKVTFSQIIYSSNNEATLEETVSLHSVFLQEDREKIKRAKTLFTLHSLRFAFFVAAVKTERPETIWTISSRCMPFLVLCEALDALLVVWNKCVCVCSAAITDECLFTFLFAFGDSEPPNAFTGAFRSSAVTNRGNLWFISKMF